VPEDSKPKQETLMEHSTSLVSCGISNTKTDKERRSPQPPPLRRKTLESDLINPGTKSIHGKLLSIGKHKTFSKALMGPTRVKDLS